MIGAIFLVDVGRIIAGMNDRLAGRHEKNFEETCSRLFDHVVNAGSKGALRISHSDMLATPGRVGERRPEMSLGLSASTPLSSSSGLVDLGGRLTPSRPVRSRERQCSAIRQTGLQPAQCFRRSLRVYCGCHPCRAARQPLRAATRGASRIAPEETHPGELNAQAATRRAASRVNTSRARRLRGCLRPAVWPRKSFEEFPIALMRPLLRWQSSFWWL